jgi:2-polyprenyl-6-methoxyphenol hydroxylase-like FAD-dependent oxidoreductase
VVGVRAKGPDGTLTIRADLTVGCDGRHSTVREKAGFKSEDYGAPMDVLWFRLPRKSGDASDTFGHIEAGRMMIMLDRGDYWQCAYVIPKGAVDAVRARGLPAFHKSVARLAPFAADRVGEVGDWEAVKLLTVKVDRLAQWYRPGLLCIGDAAHAMSPVGGVGINLAIQDAVATANLLAAPLAAGRVAVADLARVQRRRALPTRLTQRFQVAVQNRVIARVIGRVAADGKLSPPLVLRWFGAVPLLRRIPARLVGMGIRPEHVRSPTAFASDA